MEQISAFEEHVFFDVRWCFDHDLVFGASQSNCELLGDDGCSTVQCCFGFELYYTRLGVDDLNQFTFCAGTLDELMIRGWCVCNILELNCLDSASISGIKGYEWKSDLLCS